MQDYSSVLTPLLQKWPIRIRLLENLYQECERFNKTIKFKKNVLLVSVANLSEYDRNQLTYDYIKTMRYLGPCSLISHQIDPHVFFLIGDNCVDYRGLEPGQKRLLSIKPYRLAKNLKLEGLIALNPVEYENLLTYTTMASQNVQEIFGQEPLLAKIDSTKYDYTIIDYRTVGQLDNNQFLNAQSRHSCLSWFTLAPIGSERTRILDLLKFQAQDLEVSTPEYGFEYAKFILSTADNVRLPLLILQSNQTLEDISSSCANPKYLDSLVHLDPNP